MDSVQKEDLDLILASKSLEAPAIPSGSTFAGHYQILGTLGQGSMGTVYRAKHQLLERVRAIKLVSPQNSDMLTLQRFQQEAKASLSLEHQNIVRVYEYGLEPESKQPYLVMDYVAGKTLADVIAEEGQLSAERATSIMLQVADGLAHAHCKGVVHRDIKPGNIILTMGDEGKEVAKIVDFGIAKLTRAEGQDLTQTGEVFGTPLYMSPEQCMGRTVDARSDVYALGCVFYECIAGRPPIQGASSFETLMMHVHGERIDFSDKNFSTRIQTTILKALQTDPDKRLPSAEGFRDSLLEAQSPADGFMSNVQKDLLVAGRKKSNLPIQQLILVSLTAMILLVLSIFIISFMKDVHRPSPSKTAPRAVAVDAKQSTADAIKKMIASYTKEIDAHPDEDYWYIMRGTTYREAGDYANSITDFTTALSKNPSNPMTYRNRAWTYSSMADWKNSEADNTKAIELNPKYADAYIGRARAYHAQGEYQKAFDDANRAVELNPKNAMAYNNRAAARFSMKDFTASMADCDKAIALSPTDAHIRILRARVAEPLKQYEKAIEDLSFILKDDPDNVPRRLERAHINSLSNHFDLALEDLAITRKLAPNNIGGFFETATALAGLGKTNEAFAEYANVLKIDPNNSDAYKRQGDLYAKLGQKDKALSNYDQAIKVWAGNQEAQKARANLLQQ